MKTILMNITLLLSAQVFAQGAITSTVKQTWGEMSMTQEQRRQVDGIEKKYEPKFKAQRQKIKQAKAGLKSVKANPNASGSDVLQQNKALQAEENALENLRLEKQNEINALLTPEQRQKKAKKKAKKQKRRQKRKRAINNVLGS